MTDKARQASSHVRQKLAWIAKNHESSSVKALLARLRRGVGKAPGSQPDLWDITLSALPESLLSKSDEPTHGEWAVHTALTLYATHQQGQDLSKQSMDKSGVSVGDAARNLIAPDRSNEEAVRKRFHALALADSPESLAWHMRSFIQLLRANSLALDYAKLTEDFYWYQNMDRRDGIRLRWGQDFCRFAPTHDLPQGAVTEQKENEDEGQG